MTRRTRLPLLYAGPSSSRWSRAAASIPDGDLLQHCVWQWKSAALGARSAERPALRIPEHPLPADFDPVTGKRARS